MESIVLEGENIKLKIVFYDNMVKLEGTYIVDEVPPESMRDNPCRIERLADGNYKISAEFYIPNGFIFDALCISDKEVIDDFNKWLENLIEKVAHKRGIAKPSRINFEIGN